MQRKAAPLSFILDLTGPIPHLPARINPPSRFCRFFLVERELKPLDEGYPCLRHYLSPCHSVPGWLRFECRTPCVIINSPRLNKSSRYMSSRGHRR
ncbi:hypothetical protein PHAMO_170020 [Magnetospirillum molischianum DSM 120]|uniref:Uncharacterized protein n=1 Tax=Magnetospirillum molischianum DSM 120 TaxID=1150626 RepID=H8FNM3_MAGML|nr:hypothetical protein PHAMO_170020 [Magnetospirillum molischianum DSM 120]